MWEGFVTPVEYLEFRESTPNARLAFGTTGKTNSQDRRGFNVSAHDFKVVTEVEFVHWVLCLFTFESIHPTYELHSIIEGFHFQVSQGQTLFDKSFLLQNLLCVP